MKLLLTSAGISNQSIATALKNLLGKPLKGVKLAFIPTASNVEAGAKDWLIEDLVQLQELGFVIDIIDISATSQEIWLSRLKEAQVLFFEGGNTIYLAHWLNQSGLASLLPELLKTRVWIGASAGSCVVCPTIVNSVQDLFDEPYPLEITTGLSLVDFQFVPHLGSHFFPKIRKAEITAASKNLQTRDGKVVYACDDQSAVVVNDDKIEMISEGECFKLG